MATMGIFDAKTHFSEIVERAVNGEQITITRHGVPVVKMVAVSDQARDPVKIKRLLEEMRKFRKGRSLGGLKIRDLIDEGRR